MKLFHLSDLHIGLKLYNRDLAEDQNFIFCQICELVQQEQPDVLIISGDVYDKAVPSAEAIEMFDQFVESLVQAAPELEIMVISGNHDSAPRINMFRNILQRQKIHMIGLPPQQPEDHIEQITLVDEYGPIHFYLLPFVKPSMVKAVVGTDEHGNHLSYDESVRRLIQRENIDESDRNVLVSHQFYLPVGTDADCVERMDSEIRTVGNIDEVHADVLSCFDYAALGHIHKPMKVGNEFYRYCGTPLACSISEAGQQKGVVQIQLGQKGSVKTEVLPLTPLRQVRIMEGTLEEILMQGCDDYVSVVLTDKIDLDVIDMQDRLRFAFPHLLEIRRSMLRQADYTMRDFQEEEWDPLRLCCAFLKDLDEDTQEILRDVINTVGEVRK